ncbi:MAG: 5-deoxy-glucuronate isomerase [Negativicutes bacterium]|nr:5-deoxy-glucuronate isomerase [Negativicutes bacterium]
MSNFRYAKPGKGYQQIFKAGEEMKHTGLALLNLEGKQGYAGASGDEELALVILSGKCNIKVNDMTFENLGDRKDVFSGKATTVYVPIKSSYAVEEATGGKTELAVLSVPAKTRFQPFVVKPEEVAVFHRGMLNWQRDVHDLLTDNADGRVERIVLGETFSYSGQWSSYPSHKHDTYNPPMENDMEEIYLFKVNPTEGFGIQVIYNDDLSTREAYMIKDGDAVGIPSGYHPVASAPGAEVYYLWVMAGNYGRKLTPNDDPKLKWLTKLGPVLKGSGC